MHSTIRVINLRQHHESIPQMDQITFCHLILFSPLHSAFLEIQTEECDCLQIHCLFEEKKDFLKEKKWFHHKKVSFRDNLDFLCLDFYQSSSFEVQKVTYLWFDENSNHKFKYSYASNWLVLQNFQNSWKTPKKIPHDSRNNGRISLELKLFFCWIKHNKGRWIKVYWWVLIFLILYLMKRNKKLNEVNSWIRNNRKRHFKTMNKIVWKIQHRNFSLDFVCLLLKKTKTSNYFA